MRRLLALLAFCSLSPAADKPVPTAEAAAKMKLPPGFKVTLFAGEPDVVQPIAFTFDDRGRMWVVECLMYPKWSQDGKGGKDRVVILEDTDGDGKADKRTVVIDDGVNLSGIELGFGGVYLCSSPNLIFVPIQDDKPAGKAEVLLDGWNIKEAKHNVFNSLIWGPDGWLYGCNGIQTKSRVGRPGTPDKDRVFFDCGVWRFHPTRKVFEVVANGTTNPFGLDFDEHGEMFITNCVIDHLFHVVPGGHYTRMYGNDPNPHVYGYMGSAVDYKHWGGGHWTDARADQKTGAIQKAHDDAGGGHAHSGCAIYLGDNFPKEYRNTLFTANIHGNRLNNDALERTKAGMKGVRRPDFLFANDPWFRGICVKQGPAGELFVSDWCDTGECHNYDVADTTNGRIYRVTYGDLKPWAKDVSKMTDEELVQAVVSPNEWLSRKARRVLQERANSIYRDTKGRADDVVLALRNEWAQAKSLAAKMRTVWAMYVVGNTMVHDKLWGADEVELRCLAVWMMSDQAVMSGDKDLQPAYRKLALLISDDKSAIVRRTLANALRKFATEAKVNPKLKTRSAELIDDAFNDGLLDFDSDPDTTLMFWYAVEAADLDMPRLIKAKAKQPLLFEYLTRKRLATVPDPKAELETILEAMPTLPSDECRSAVLRGIAENLRGSNVLKPTNTWRTIYLQYVLTKSVELRGLLDDVGLQFGDQMVIDSLRKQANDKSSTDRARIINALATRKVSGFDANLRTYLSAADPTVRAAALRGLANYADDKTPAAILDVYPKLTPEEKADAVQTLSSRAAYAAALLAAVEKGTVPKGDITAFTARQIVSLKDRSLADKLKAVWGEVRAANTNRAADIAKYKGQLKPDYVSAGDAAKGKVLFAKHCGTCHKLFGEGQAVGPELTGSQRTNLDYLVENVVDPNAVVPYDYKMTQFFLKDGRQVSGLVRKDTPQAVTVRTVNEEVVIPTKDIDERKPTNNSVMPEGLFDALKPDEVRDLVKYLMSK